MIACCLMILAASVFGGVEPIPVADVLTPERLARVVGEAGGIGIWKTQEKMRDAWRALMYVALNRHRSPAFPTARSFLQGFYRLDPSPPSEAIEMAREVLAADEDPTDGCIYALSAQDLELLGIEREGDIVLTGNSVFQLHFYKSWPVMRNND